jgi:hypothetical protein
MELPAGIFGPVSSKMGLSLAIVLRGVSLGLLYPEELEASALFPKEGSSIDRIHCSDGESV